VHTNLSEQASIGGEAWVRPGQHSDHQCRLLALRHGAGITPEQWDASVRARGRLGYTVNPIPFGSRCALKFWELIWVQFC
jgi:hypothetical protein